MTKTIALITATLPLFLAFSASAQTKKANAKKVEEKPVLSLQQQAEEATKISDPKVLSQIETAPEAQVSSGALTLDDPFEPLTMRTFVWNFGFQLQSYQPQGVANLGDQATRYNLSEAGSTVLPSFSLGTLYNVGHSPTFGKFQLGLNGQAGYISQNIKAVTSNNVAIDAKLNTTQLEAKASLRWSYKPTSQLHVLAQAGIGQLNVSQSSENSMARWNQSATYQVSGLGLEYNLNNEWLAQANYNQKSMRDENSELDIQNNNIELGAKILW